MPYVFFLSKFIPFIFLSLFDSFANSSEQFRLKTILKKFISTDARCAKRCHRAAPETVIPMSELSKTAHAIDFRSYM